MAAFRYTFSVSAVGLTSSDSINLDQPRSTSINLDQPRSTVATLQSKRCAARRDDRE
jgi:hypothetical protein